MPTTYQYPLDGSTYKANVVFGLVKTETTGATTAEVLTQTVENNKKKRDELLASLREELQEIEEDDNLSTSQKAEKKAEIRAQIEEINNEIMQHAGLASQAQSATTINVSDTTVQLYLPAGLAFRDNVTYENFQLGGVGATMEAGLGFAESVMKGVGSFINNSSGSNGADLAKLAGIQLSSQFGSVADEVRAVQQLSGGVTLNPNERVLFKQPNIREFAFTFKFVAKSEEERLHVDNIVKFFRRELYPEDISTTVGGQPLKLGYKFPNKFSIQFRYDGKKIPGLAKIGNCFLRDVSTTYNASQMAMHSDGSFMEVDMSLMFQETHALSKADIDEGF